MSMKFMRRTVKRLRGFWRSGVSLRVSLMLMVVLGVCTPGVLLLAVEQQLAESAQQAHREQDEEALMRIGSLSMVEPSWELNQQSLVDVAASLLKSPQLVAVRFEHAMAKELDIELRSPTFTGALDLEVQKGQLIRRSEPVLRGTEQLGTLIVWFDAAYGDALLQARRTQMATLVTIQVLASLLLLVPVLVYRIFRPIKRLKEQTTTLLAQAEGMPHKKYFWSRRDELGMLGRHLSHVQSQLLKLYLQTRAQNDLLQKMALYDPLTGLANRTLFKDLVQREMQHAKRGEEPFGIFFIDLDRFKTVNDSMGHAAGDAVLVEVAKRLKDALREVDAVCRQSGDEFLVLLRQLEHWGFLAEVAKRVLLSIEAPVSTPAGNTRVSASIGIAIFPQDGEDVETLIKSADLAMFDAKAKGRARYGFFHSDLNAKLQTNLELDQQLANAVACNEFVLHYQPQVNAESGELVGVEALVRWQHPVRGLLYPGTFIGIAEESGRIADIGTWTMQEACRQMAEWKANGLNIGCMSVNVSALEFRDHRLLESLQSALRRSGLAPSELELEITESVLMAETETSQSIIERMREIGVGLAIDDFGTGYSSLSYLKRLRPNQLKIDQTFVRDACTDGDTRAIIRGMVGLATALGLNVVAEGVETAEQWSFLRQCGCQTLQGYYISRPLSVAQFQDWMNRRKSTASLTAPTEP